MNQTEKLDIKKLLGVLTSNGSLHLLQPTELAVWLAKLKNYLHLNPFTNSILLYSNPKGELFPYVTKDACAQLRVIREISVTQMSDPIYIPELKTVTVKISGMTKKGRMEMALGSVSLENVVPQEFANHIMWAETKAHRRLTLSLSGLGLLADVEVHDMTEVTSYNAIDEPADAPKKDNSEAVAKAISTFIRIPTT